MLMNKIEPAPVFIFNCHYNGLAQIQALGRKGIPVYALDTHRSVGTFSRYSKFIKVPDPLFEEDKFIQSLIALAKQFNSKPLLLPTNDHWSEAISKHKKILSDYCVVSASDYKTTKLLLDKYAFAKWCFINKFQAPEVFDINEEPIKSLSFPLAVKAKSRRRTGNTNNATTWTQAADNLRFVICNNKSELDHTVEYAKSHDIPVYVQKIVNGDSSSMRTIGVFANKGEVKGIIYGKKIKGYPAQYGDCIVGEAQPVPGWAKKLVIDICGKLQYTGIAEFELMEDAISGKFYIIEINPRSWSWIGVGPKSCVDLPWIAFKELVLNETTNEIIESCSNNENVLFIKVFEDFLNSLYFYKKEGTYKWHMGFRKWILQYKNRKKVFAEISADDPAIIFYAFLQFLKRLGGIIINELFGISISKLKQLFSAE